MIHARPAVAISCGVLLVAALAATSYYVHSQQGKAAQATIESGVVLLPGETLVAPAEPVIANAAPAPATPKARKQPSTPQYTRDEVLKRR